ncbi:SusC/RagA family TonB-linked outer membrane protein [Flavihumibacter rivuli]|uniref:SusC/RagA family TonB-linked outer membrane protein n=1 Tax=Flavihumibacter rivuli TaxID=2838156 RepID=UPI001BDDF6E1|nr:SusC/RagA family TonB-linked outer membrane protein [Flavihumibacter rivuli]ULQ56110.1 SusC/RagA family TonB-linked outer membrane protein [Flavihumibacter rivuli]
MRKLLLWVNIVATLCLPLLGIAQQRQVSGKVTNAKGEPLNAASVLVKGGNSGTSTNEEGNFNLVVNDNNAVLVVSSAGYQQQEVKVGNRSIISIVLKEGDNMEEVVVTAFGVKREKRALGYSAQEIKGTDLVNARQPNVLNAMQGKLAGVQINSTGGAPGQGSRIVIRGIKSLDPSKDNQPLFVIDGIIMDNSTTTGLSGNDQSGLRGMSNRAADINPDDIETLSVLKGGAATALYGQAGSNGVVVITTKSAKSGKMRVNFSTTYGVDQVNKFPDVQRTYSQGYLGVYDPASFWPSWGPTTEAAKAIDPTHPDRIYHHYKQGYQDGNQFRASVNLSGGTEKALLTSSFSYFKQNGTIPNTDYKNISARIGGQFKLSEKLKFSPSIYYINSGGYRYNADRYNESLTYWSPRWDVMDYINPDGTMKTYGNNNPVYGTATNRYKDDVNRIIANGLVSYSPVKWLTIDYRFGIDYYADFRTHTAPGPKGITGERPYEDNGLGFVYEYRINNRILNSNLIATMRKSWTDKFNTILRVGHDVRDRKFQSLVAEGEELDIPDLLSLNNTKFRTNSQNNSMYRIVSVFGDLTLSWDNYLFLTLTGRNDWSSTLAKGNNSFFYPSASLSYVFSDMFNLPDWISLGKLRASYAEIGKDTDPYRNNSYYTSTQLQSNGQILWTRADSRGDLNLKPERTKTIELGADFRFLKNRLGLEFTWYKLRSVDQIIPVSVSPSTGYTQFFLNAGELENKGIEIGLTATPVETRDFRWDVSVNYSRNRNKVLALTSGLTEITVASQFGYAGSTATMKYVPGYPVGNIYGSTYLRYYGDKEDDKTTVDGSLPWVIASSGSNAGFPVRDGAQRILGNSQPKWIGGITNTFTYKNLSLSFLFDTQQGQFRYNQLDNFMSAFGIAAYTENRNDTRVFNGVLNNGTTNTQSVWLGQGVGPDGRNYGNGYYRNVYRSITENFVEDASWVRLRNLSLSYQFSRDLLGKTFIDGASITLTGNNLWLITNYSGFDPESSSSSAGSNVDAFSGFTYPAVRSLLLTLNLNF